MRFDPDRFRPEVGQHLPRYAFMPFGGGPRICIGNHFALMEGQTILAQLSRFALVRGISNNCFKRLDITAARELFGYAPQDDAFAIFQADLPAWLQG
jgi:hypothetical protein